MENLEDIFLILGTFIIFVLIFALVIYIILGIVLTKLNKKIYGKKTILAWLPFFNIYLLGKLTVNKLMGFVLVLFSLLGTSFEYTNGGNKVVYVIIPDSLRPYYIGIYAIVIISLFIYAVFKLNKLGKDEESYINEVYLNQKTKKEIEEEDEIVPLVKWDDTSSTNVNQGLLIEEVNNDNITNNLPIEEEFDDNINIINNNSVNSTINQVEEKTIEPSTLSNESSNLGSYPDEPYDYNNPKIQEAIDNIIYKDDIEVI